jgi:hypothetical protein
LAFVLLRSCSFAVSALIAAYRRVSPRIAAYRLQMQATFQIFPIHDPQQRPAPACRQAQEISEIRQNRIAP